MVVENNIPEDWIETTLEENISVIAMGPFGSNLKRDMFTKEGVPIIKGTNLSGMYVGGDFTFVSEEKATSLRKAVAYPNDIIITHRGTIGQVSLVPQNKYKRYVTSQSQLRFSPDPQKLDYKYILYFLRSRVGQYELLKSSSQVGVPAIATPTKSIKEINLFLPSLPEQKAIAKVLTAFDDKIELLQAQNKTLESMAQTIFKEWFGKYQIGDELPEGWRVGVIGDLIEIKRGGSPRPIKDYISDSGYRWLKISDASATSSPYIFIIKEHIKFLAVDTCVHDGWMHFSNAKVSNEYLYLLFLNIRPKLLQQGSGSVFVNLKTDTLRQFETIIASKNDFETFDNLIKPIFTKIYNNALQIQPLTKTRDTLLPKLMSGKVMVNNIKQLASA